MKILCTVVLVLMAALASVKTQSDGCNMCHDYAHCNETTGYQCVCYDGFTGNGTNCEDVNECEMNMGICGNELFAECINQPGYYTCNCRVDRGYYYDENRRICDNDVAAILDLPTEYDATIIGPTDTCSPEDTALAREQINREINDGLIDGLRTLGIIQDGSGSDSGS